MDPNLIHDPNWSGVAVFVLLMAAAVLGTLFFNRSTNGDWVDERQGAGSVEDTWGLPG